MAMARRVSPHQSKPQPIVQELDCEPDLWTLCQRLSGLPHVLFLDSVKGPNGLCRYSFLTAEPFRWLSAKNGQVRIFDPHLMNEPVLLARRADPLKILAKHLQSLTMPTLPGLPPFQGGAAGLLGYELCHHIESLPRPYLDEFAVPDMAIGFYDWVIALNHETRQLWLISTGMPETGTRRVDRAHKRRDEVLAWLDQSVENYANYSQVRTDPALEIPPGYPVAGVPGLTSNFNRADYLRTIQRAVDYIHAGDCFQVNVAQRLLYPANESALQLYGRLRESNPAPFAGYFDMGPFALASASPERFVRLQNGHIETRPIKGTRPRGNTPEEEQANAGELLASAKDRAENVMIVDLLRNDLGRVCRYGSIDVTRVCQLETFEYVHHLVSEIHGQLRSDLSAIDLLRATFPGGSITGAPKVRAMEIITELEQTARGPYCGSLGYIGFDGNMDSNILIRTFTVGRGWVQFSVGGGIVADSDPEAEYEETWHKAHGSMRALL